MKSLIPSYLFENVLSPQFCIKNLLTEFSYGTEESDRRCSVIPHKNCLLNQHFSPHLVHAHSEQCCKWPLRIMHYILSVTNCTLLTADTVFWCTKKILFPIGDFFLFFHKNNIIPDLTVPPLSQLTSCTPTTSNLYLGNSLAAAVSEPDLYRLPSFYVPNFWPFPITWVVPRDQSRLKAHVSQSFEGHFLWWGVVSTSPYP
jgi:hypothetical protein